MGIKYADTKEKIDTNSPLFPKFTTEEAKENHIAKAVAVVTKRVVEIEEPDALRENTHCVDKGEDSEVDTYWTFGKLKL